MSRRFSPAAYFGWGGLALLVVVGASSSGVSGAAAMFGTFALGVALVALVRGRAGWAHLRRGATSLVALGVALTAFTVSGLAAPAQNTSADGHHVARSHHVAGSTTPVAAPTTPEVATTSSVAAPTKHHHEKAASRPAPQPRPKHQHHRAAVGDLITAAGVVLPNRARTPGAVNPDVTPATTGRTICVSGWTSTVRPSSSVTTDLKVAQLESGYAYEGDTATSDYEEDHLISLELGGAPNDPRNLWPEPYNNPEGARIKDLVENKLHALVCSHTISLATAQHAIATNWWTAYQTYGGTAYSAPSHHTVHHTASPAPGPAPVAPGNRATARCNDGTYSYAAHHQGACTHHGGVQIFYK